MTGPFNLRVYALCIENDAILLSTESAENISFTKFPGGGIEPGEGIVDALKREMAEELKTKVSEYSLYYVNEFHQPSTFQPEQQIISFYYKVKLSEAPNLGMFTETRWNKRFEVRCYFKKLEELNTHELTFPIDKLVLEKLKIDYLNK